MRISRLDRTSVDEKAAEVCDHYETVRGNVRNMLGPMAHLPEIMRTTVAHFSAIMETGTVSQKLKELVIARSSQINRCEY